MVAQFKFTVLLMPNGPQKITGLPFDTELYKSEHSIEDQEIQVTRPGSTGQMFSFILLIMTELIMLIKLKMYRLVISTNQKF